jgi:TPR repeat protein
VVAVLITRGDQLLVTGDFTAARLMYQRAAMSKSAQGAIALGMTYDPRFLAQIGARGIAAEPHQAIAWYKRASDLGSPDGARLEAQLMTATTK